MSNLKTKLMLVLCLPFLFSMNGVAGGATASVSAWASGSYKKGTAEYCEPGGFCLTRYGVSDTTATGTVTFEMLGISYSVTSDPVIIHAP